MSVTSSAQTAANGAREDAPTVVGDRDQPVEFSTCVALVRRPEIIWDTNRYYATLGVHPRATRREIRHAYQAVMHDLNARAAYVVKQLLNPVIREEYDNTPLGRVFVDQEIVLEMVRRASDRIAKMRLEGLSDEADEAEQSFLDWMDASDEAALDDRRRRDHNDPTAPTVYPWSYYQWRTECADTARLDRWRSALIGAVAERGHVANLAVGFVGDMAFPFVVMVVGYRLVVMIRDDEEPTEALADEAASRVMHHLNRRDK